MPKKSFGEEGSGNGRRGIETISSEDTPRHSARADALVVQPPEGRRAMAGTGGRSPEMRREHCVAEERGDRRHQTTMAGACHERIDLF